MRIRKMSLWLVRAGKYGEQEEAALENGLVVIGWDELPDLSFIKSREQLKEVYEQANPGFKKMRVANEVGQVWAFINRIQINDMVVLPLKTRAAIAIGKVKGAYQYRSDLPPGMYHTRAVDWIKTDLPRTIFDQDLLYSFGARILMKMSCATIKN
jgi:restriction system protein